MTKTDIHSPEPSLARRDLLVGGVALASLAAAGSAAAQAASTPSKPPSKPPAKGQITDRKTMSSGFVTTKDGTEIFYKDWGPKTAQP